MEKGDVRTDKPSTILHLRGVPGRGRPGHIHSRPEQGRNILSGRKASSIRKERLWLYASRNRVNKCTSLNEEWRFTLWMKNESGVNGTYALKGGKETNFLSQREHARSSNGLVRQRRR